MSPFTGSRTPESTASMSSISSYLGYNNYPVSQYKLSDKLQIIKPLEGMLGQNFILTVPLNVISVHPDKYSLILFTGSQRLKYTVTNNYYFSVHTRLLK